MAQLYLRTEAEMIADDLLCAEPCEHRDCAQTRLDVAALCRYCGKVAAGASCFYEDGAPVHAVCAYEDTVGGAV